MRRFRFLAIPYLHQAMGICCRCCGCTTYSGRRLHNAKHFGHRSEGRALKYYDNGTMLTDREQQKLLLVRSMADRVELGVGRRPHLWSYKAGRKVVEGQRGLARSRSDKMQVRAVRLCMYCFDNQLRTLRILGCVRWGAGDVIR